MMRLETPSRLSHPPPPPTRFLSSTPPSSNSLIRSRSSLLFKKQPIMASSSSIRAVDDRDRRRSIGNPEPPWLVLPPEAPENPFSSENLLVKGTGTGIPSSLRLVQMKKRLLAIELGNSKEVSSSSSSLESAIVKAISSLAFMIGELQRSVFVDPTEVEVLARVSRDRSDSFVWLFRSVFSGSPNLVVQLLILLAEFVVFSVESDKSFSAGAIVAKTHDEINSGSLKGPEVVDGDTICASVKFSLPTVRDFIENWSDIGIKEGKGVVKEDKACIDRRRRMYEWSIASGEVNSLILSNYAQFLYRVAQDHDRADQYFQWAVAAEPHDDEAMSRYAFFLWEVRGDITAAEEMFLEAMDADPGNPYHNSNYAFFLLKTGAVDTCYPIA